MHLNAFIVAQCSKHHRLMECGAQRRYCCPQMVLAVQRGQRSGRLLQYAAARAALWLYHELPALLEALLAPCKVRARLPVRHAFKTCVAYFRRRLAGRALRKLARVSCRSGKCSVAVLTRGGSAGAVSTPNHAHVGTFRGRGCQVCL